MKLIDPYQQLDAYHFWRIQTVNNSRYGRHYQVRVNHDQHYFEANGLSVAAAVDRVLAKIKKGFVRGSRRKQKSAPRLKLAKFEDAVEGDF